MTNNLVPLGSITTINPGTRKGLDLSSVCSFIPMDCVDEKTGSISHQGKRLVGEVMKGYTPFEENDVLFAKITPCMENGKVAIARNLANGIGFGTTEFHVLRVGPRVLPEWVFYFLRQQSFRDQAERRMRGSAGQKRVPEEFLLEAPIPLPRLDDQQALVHDLQVAEKLLRLRRQVAAQLEGLLSSTFLEMFGDPVSNPCNWNMVPVSDFVGSFETGKSIMSEATDSESKYRILKVSAITWNEYNPSESKPVPENHVPAEHHFVRGCDLLFSRANTTELVGAVAYVFRTPPNILLPDKIWRFIWKKSRVVEPLFVWQLFLQKSVRDEIGRRATGTSGSMKNISMEKVLEMKLPLPPIELQRKFASIVQVIQRQRSLEQESVRQSQLLFEALLERSFSHAVLDSRNDLQLARGAR